jgi:hypothetical protein
VVVVSLISDRATTMNDGTEEAEKTLVENVEPAWDVTSPYISSLREKVLEYRFLGDLTAELLRRRTVFDVMRGDVDAQGYDIVVEANGIVRHIQLKAMMAGGKRAHVDVNVKLRAKPSGCVVWMIYDPASLQPGPYRWFGGAPGEELPEIGEKPVKHSKANAAGTKLVRPGLRLVPKSSFETITDISELACRLFGPVRSDIAILLDAQLRRSAGSDVRAEIARLCPRDFAWDGSVELAHMVSGYKLIEQSGRGDPFEWENATLTAAEEKGRWPGALPELWAALFLEHRRWRMSSPFAPEGAMKALLDTLCHQLRGGLIAGGYLMN